VQPNEPEAEAAMKKYSTLLITALMFAVAFSTTDANARTRGYCDAIFPIVLGVGY
jgi:hypothetical protein